MGNAKHFPFQWHTPDKRVETLSSTSIVHVHLFYFYLHDDYCCHLLNTAVPPPFYCWKSKQWKNILWCAQFQSVQHRADNHWTDWNEIQTQTVPQFTNSRTNTREQNIRIRSKSFEMINKLDGDLIISSLLLWLTLEVTSISAFIFVAIYVWRMAFGLLRMHYKIIQFEWD